MEALAVVAFTLLTISFAEGDEKAGTAFPAPTGASLGVGTMAALLSGCLTGNAVPACTKTQAQLLSEGRSQWNNRLTVNQCKFAESHAEAAQA